jgi:hypothetical protein
MLGKYRSGCDESCQKREKAITKQMNSYKAPLTSRNYHKELTLQLFQSPIASKSKLGQYIPIMTRDTLYNKLLYRPHNKFNDAIREKDAIIKMLIRRLHITSPKDTRYTIIQQQLEALNKQVADLKEQKNELFAKRDELLKYATEHAGNVVPVDALRQVMTGKLSPRRALIPAHQRYEDELSESTAPESEAGVSAFSTGPLGGDADIKQEQDEAPEGDEASAPEVEEVEPPPKPPIEYTPIKSDTEDSEPSHPVGSETDTEQLRQLLKNDKSKTGRTLYRQFYPDEDSSSESGSESEQEQELETELPAETKMNPDVERALSQYETETENENTENRYKKYHKGYQTQAEPLSEEDIFSPKVAKEVAESMSESDYPTDVVNRDFQKFDKYKLKIDAGKKLTALQAEDYIRLVRKYRKASGMTHSEAERAVESVKATAQRQRTQLSREQKDRANELARLRRRRKREAELNAKRLQLTE